MNQASEKRLANVMPLLARKVRAVIDALAKRGMIVEVVQGLRTVAEQDKLFAQGRTRPGQIVTRARGGQSAHNYGIACDLCPFVDGKPDWNSRAAFIQIGAEAGKIGLNWGGNWKKFVDMPHVELPSPAIIRLYALYKSGGLPAVWSEVEKYGTK